MSEYYAAEFVYFGDVENEFEDLFLSPNEGNSHHHLHRGWTTSDFFKWAFTDTNVHVVYIFILLLIDDMRYAPYFKNMTICKGNHGRNAKIIWVGIKKSVILSSDIKQTDVSDSIVNWPISIQSFCVLFVALSQIQIQCGIASIHKRIFNFEFIVIK